MTDAERASQRDGLDLFGRLEMRHIFRAADDRDLGEGWVASGDAAQEVMATWPGHARTPLLDLAPLALWTGLGGILMKDEAPRFGLGSFKAMGAAYALLSLVAERLGLPGARDFESVAGRHDDVGMRGFVVAAATDGNHGRALAWAADRLGVGCVIFVHSGVSADRVQAIESLGAEVRRVEGNYDHAVRTADEQARANGWQVVSDTAYGGYVEIPRRIMEGYAGIASEIVEQLGARRITHVFLQAGVGGFAAALFAYLAKVHADAITFVVVEADAAGCLFASASARRRVVLGGDLDTLLAGLACGAPSTVAWDMLTRQDCHYLLIDDRAAVETMRLLARSGIVAPPVVSGESGAAGLAALLCAAASPAHRQALGLTPASVVLTVSTEGATDFTLYRELVGMDADAVAGPRPSDAGLEPSS